MARVVDLRDKLSLFSEHWSPKVVATLNDYEVKVVKVKGEFVWHSHADTDELFLVVDGSLTIRLPDGDVSLGPGQLFVVPRGRRALPGRRRGGLARAHRADRGGQHRRGRRRPDRHARHDPARRLSARRTQISHLVARGVRSSACELGVRDAAARMPARAPAAQARPVPLMVADPTTRVPS